MQQILLRVPIIEQPIYGFGFMLFCAFFGCAMLAIRLARPHGIPKEPMWDLATWLILTGVVGARITYIIQFWAGFYNIWQFFAVWDGGLVFYGSIPGAAVGYLVVYWTTLKKYGVSHWQMADIIAPCLALGLCLGRVGCLLNGCCFGNVACAAGPAITFPMTSPPRDFLVSKGLQTPTGFLTEPGQPRVRALEPVSAAAEAGLDPGVLIERVNDRPVEGPLDPAAMGKDWRGEHWMKLEVKGADGIGRVVGPFAPRTLALYPTQIFESISMALLLFLLLCYHPYRLRDGSVMVLMMFGYAIHRFLNEMLRVDNEEAAFGMTLSQNISVAVFAAALVLAIIVWRRPPPITLAPTISSLPPSPEQFPAS